jgi:formate hydrogenlyase subunit 4
MMEGIFATLFQIALVLLLAPLITGFNRVFKARVQTRQGPSLIQPYRDLYKLLRKGMVIPETASWIFSATPLVLFVTTLLASLLIPTVCARAPLSVFGGVLAVVYLLALGRFFLALGGLDAGSSFGGLGSSREMTISAIAEPALMLALFTVALGANTSVAIGSGSTNLSIVALSELGHSWLFLAPSQMLAFAALFIVLIAETGRIPVDNPATHLELTMIHEAMILEYSGSYLALIEWAAAIKQLLLMTILVNIFFPFGLSMTWAPAAVLSSLLWFLLKLLLLSLVVGVVEVSNAKMRLFRVPELLAVAFVLGALALISTFLFQG